MTSRRSRFRTKLCRNFALGHCPQGSQCKYIHSVLPTLPVAFSVPPAVQIMQQQSLPLEVAPNFIFPVSVHPSAQWMLPSPSTRSSDTMWTLSPVQNISNNTTQGATNSGAQLKSLAWRTSLCRHFVRNRGWCPVGDDCNYIHDLALADLALEDVRNLSNQLRDSTMGSAVAKKNSGGSSKAGSKHSHCWAYVQGLCHVQDCPYLHPVAVNKFVPHTPCLAWPNCYKGILCPFKHPEPMIQNVSISAPDRGETNLQQPQFGLPATFQPGAISASAGIPSNGPYQAYGTTYFPTISQGPSSPPQVPFAPQLARWAQPYGNWQPSYGVVPSEYPHFSSAYLQQQPLYETSVASPTMPAISQSPVHENLNFDRHSGYHDVPVPMQISEPSPADQFPYIAPREQRPGHARRISVALKSKEDTDAIELQARNMSRRRESWMTHGHHATHKSWAPSSSTALSFAAAPSPSICLPV